MREGIDIENGKVKARFTIERGGVRQEYLARGDGRWVVVVESFRPPAPFPAGANALYNSSIDKDNRLIVTEALDTVRRVEHADGTLCAVLTGRLGRIPIQQIVTLRPGEPYFHIEVRATLLEENPTLDYLLLPFSVVIDGGPDYTHVPSYKRSPDNVIGDRVFLAPAAIIQKGGTLAALVPDVDLINERVVYARGARTHPQSNSFAVWVDPDRVSMPVALDLELQSGLTDRPLMSYGMMDVIAEQHVFWNRDNTKGSMVRALSSNQIGFGVDLFISVDAQTSRGYQTVAKHHWERYGTRYFHMPRPQAMPYAEYAKTCYPATFDYQGYEVVGLESLTHRDLPDRPDLKVWQQWESDNGPVGGLRLTAPQWSQYIYFTAWWNNVCDATGLYFWGRRLGDGSLVDKARRIVNLALSAPQNEKGMFPSLYNLRTGTWNPSFWHPPLNGYDPNKAASYWSFANEGLGAYQTAAASVTAGYLMQYYRTCESDLRILSYVRAYADLLAGYSSTGDCIPAWFDKDMRPLPSLSWNADGGAHTWVLSELYRMTRDEVYLEAARRTARFVIDEVMPGQRWSDFEAFYSCAIKPETFYDERTGQPGRCLMSMSWALQGFLALYEVTQEAAYLEAAEAVADYSCLFQAVWAPHFVVTAYPFGGFISQTGDAEWLDQRSHRFADPLVRVGLLTNRRDLVERGVAAARSSLTLCSHPRHVSNEIYVHTDFPVGLGPENIDHEGFPQRPLSSGPSWNTVGGMASAAHILRLLGGVYMDFEKNMKLGVDGVEVIHAEMVGRSIRISLRSLMSELPMPFSRSYETTLKIAGLSGQEDYELCINDAAPVNVPGSALSDFPIVIFPDGRALPVITHRWVASQ